MIFTVLITSSFIYLFKLSKVTRSTSVFNTDRTWRRIATKSNNVFLLFGLNRMSKSTSLERVAVPLAYEPKTPAKIILFLVKIFFRVSTRLELNRVLSIDLFYALVRYIAIKFELSKCICGLLPSITYLFFGCMMEAFPSALNRGI